MSNKPFLRRAELIVGPLTEDRGGGPTNQGIKITSDGTRNNLRISFSVKKTLLSTPNASEITIYNLSPGNRDRLRASLTRVRLSVGWDNIGFATIAQGALLSLVTKKNGPDYETVLKVMDGYGGQVKGVSNVSFDGTQRIEDVLRGLVKDMPGVQIGRIAVDGRLGSRGRSFSGRTAEELDKLADQYGFSWSIQNGVFQAISDAAAFDRVRRISYRDRTLIGATPILNGPMQQETGVEILSIMDPRLVPGEVVLLESSANSQLNGRYKVHEIDYNGDTFGDEWTMLVKSFKVL